MRSLFDDIISTLEAQTFTIPNVSVRKPYDESPKTYPMIVVTEISNLPKNHATVNGEQRTILGYQLDVYTVNCVDSSDEVLGRWEAGQRLSHEAADLLSETYKLTRRSVLPQDSNDVEVQRFLVRVEGLLDSYGYAYRT